MFLSPSLEELVSSSALILILVRAEPSQDLAPVVVNTIFASLAGTNRAGTSILLEQMS